MWYWSFDFEKGFSDILNVIFSGINDMLLAPTRAFFSTIVKNVYGLYYPPNVDIIATKKVDIDNGSSAPTYGAIVTATMRFLLLFMDIVLMLLVLR